MSTASEEQWNRDSVADCVVLMSIDGKPEMVGIIGDSGEVEAPYDEHLARAVAVRLVELAEQLPELPRILRRASDVDDELRSLDD